MEKCGVCSGMKPFTIEQAEKNIPLISKLLSKAQRFRDKIAWVLETNDMVLEVSTEGGFHYFMTDQVRVNKEFHKMYYNFYRIIEKLNELGVIVKDIDEGIVDFPFELNEREVFLCWRAGEKKISHYHDFDCEDRKPIIDLDRFVQKNL